MKLAFQLAYRNLVGAGLRTWLNVGVLSFAFVMIILFNGMLDGWNYQAKNDSIAWEYGAGQLSHAEYDPYDPFSLQDGHGALPEGTDDSHLNPVLLRQASLYPEGRMVSVMLKGIDPQQTALELPTSFLEARPEVVPAIIGTRMAKSTGLEVGDEVLIRWRDHNGTFDARNVQIAHVFKANVPTVDNGQLWIPIDRLWSMTGLENHATYFIADADYQTQPVEGWKFQDQEALLAEITELIQTKKASSSIMYLILLAIALLAIFDTQVLSIFRRQKEIGTYISLGMTRWQVVGLFTVEGGMYSLFAMLVGCLYGIPLFVWLSKVGIPMPAASDDMGLAVAESIIPVYGIELIVSTIFLVVISATLVSFLPARKIAKMDPVAALKGKVQ